MPYCSNCKSWTHLALNCPTLPGIEKPRRKVKPDIPRVTEEDFAKLRELQRISDEIGKENEKRRKRLGLDDTVTPVTKSVTKPAIPVTKVLDVTKPITGRPRIHASNAERQAAYRERRLRG